MAFINLYWAQQQFESSSVALAKGMMLAGAIQVNIQIMRAFVRFQEILGGHRVLRAKLDALEKKYDVQFKIVFDAIRRLMPPPGGPKQVGFRL